MKTRVSGAGAVALVLSLLLALALSAGAFAQDASGDPEPGTVVNSAPTTLLATRVITTDQATPAQAIDRWNGVDLFVAVDVASGGALTGTVQFSADGSNWADGYWYSVTSTGTLVSNLYRTIQTADGTTYIKVPTAGQYMRINLDVTGTVTPTIAGVYKNN